MPFAGFYLLDWLINERSKPPSQVFLFRLELNHAVLISWTAGLNRETWNDGRGRARRLSREHKHSPTLATMIGWVDEVNDEFDSLALALCRYESCKVHKDAATTKPQAA